MIHHNFSKIRAVIKLGLVLSAGFFANASMAQAPACLTAPVANQTCVDVVIANPALTNGGRTGTASMPANDDKGNDSSNVNHVVRTLDNVLYDVKYSVNNTLPVDGKVTLTFTMPTGMTFSQTAGNFPLCTGNGGGVLAGQVLTCEINVGSVPVTSSLPITGIVKFDTPDGTVLVPQASITTGTSNGPVARTGYQNISTETNIDAAACALPARATFPGQCGDMVSAAPKFDLEKGNAPNVNYATGQRRVFYREITDDGPGGATGFVVGYTVALSLPGDGKGGAPLTPAPSVINLVDKLSFSPTTTAFGTLLSCAPNGDSSGRPIKTRYGAAGTRLRNLNYPYAKIGYADGLPAGTARNSVVDSGSIACAQASPGADVAMTITTAPNQFNPATYPERRMDDLSVSPRKYAGIYNIYYFYPAAAIIAAPNNTITEKNRIGEADATTTSGIKGLSVGGNIEPDAIQVATISTNSTVDDANTNNYGRETLVGGVGGYKIWRQVPNSTTPGVGSTLNDSYDPQYRHGTAFVGQKITGDFSLGTRSALGSYTDLLMCDEWDNSRTILTPLTGVSGSSDMWLAGEISAGNSVVNLIFAPTVTTAGASFTLEYSNDAGTKPNIDYANNSANGSRGIASAAECGSGTWTQVGATRAAPFAGRNIFTAADFAAAGAANLANVKRLRVVFTGDIAATDMYLRTSQEVLSNPPGTWLPNRTSIAWKGMPTSGSTTTGTLGSPTDPLRRYLENDHAQIKGASATVSKTGSASSAALNQTITFTIQPKFAAIATGTQPPSGQPVVVKDYVPEGYTYVVGSASPALFVPAAPGVKPVGFQNAGQNSTVLEWQFPNATPDAVLPTITYQATVNLSALNGVPLRNEVEITHPLDPTPLTNPVTGGFNSAEDRYTYWDVTPSIPSELLIQKATSTPFIDPAGTQQWQLVYKNNTAGTFASMRIIDILPRNTDAINTSNLFNGAFGGGTLSALPSVPAGSPGTYSYFYTTTPAASVNRNPRCASNGGTLPDGAGQCPNAGATWTTAAAGVIPAGATAFRVDDAAALTAGVLRSVNLEIATVDNLGGDLYENSFQGADPAASLVVNSNKPQIRVPDGSVGGFVYVDAANDGLRAGDAGIGGTALQLTGNTVDGKALVFNVSTCAAASCPTITVSGTYDGAPFTRTCTGPFAQGQYQFCGVPTSDTAGYTITETQPAGYADGKDGQSPTLAGTLASGSPVGTAPGNDTISGIRVTSNLTTGAGDVGTEFNFGEIQSTSISGTVFQESSGVNSSVPDGADAPIPGVIISLTGGPGGTTYYTCTNASGAYSFGAGSTVWTAPPANCAAPGSTTLIGLPPGTYNVIEGPVPAPYTENAAFPGTVTGAGSTPGTAAGNTVINTITVAAGGASVNNNFSHLGALLVDLSTTTTGVVNPGGSNGTFTVVTNNNGSNPTSNVVTTLTVPAGLDPAQVVVSNGGVYDPATGVITWPNVATVPPGGSASYTVTVPVTPGTPVVGNANVNSYTTPGGTTPVVEINTANNPSTASVNAAVTADLSTTTTATLDPGGTTGTFTVVTNNNGPNAMPNVVTTLTVPAGLDPAKVVVSDGGTYDQATGVITWPSVPSVAPGGNTSYTVTVPVTPGTPVVGNANVNAYTTPGGTVPVLETDLANNPSSATVSANPTGIPSLSAWGLVLLSMLLGGLAYARRRSMF